MVGLKSSLGGSRLFGDFAAEIGASRHDFSKPQVLSADQLFQSGPKGGFGSPQDLRYKRILRNEATLQKAAESVMERPYKLRNALSTPELLDAPSKCLQDARQRLGKVVGDKVQHAFLETSFAPARSFMRSSRLSKLRKEVSWARGYKEHFNPEVKGSVSFMEAATEALKAMQRAHALKEEAFRAAQLQDRENFRRPVRRRSFAKNEEEIVKLPGTREATPPRQPEEIVREAMRMLQKWKLHEEVAHVLCDALLSMAEALASSNPSVAATLHALTGLSAPVRASTAVNLETAAELAASRGCIGALYLRIVSAKALPKDGAAPFVRARLGGASGAGAAAQRTETAAGVAPRWDGTPFVFEVPNPDASITMEVLSSDETGDDLLGSASFKVLEKAPESSKMPKLMSLSLSAGGSLDFEILFRAAKSGGYAPRGTQSVVAGLTAALWDLENAKVEDGWIVSGVGGVKSGVGGLACPAGHPIDKRKEGMSWRQSCLQGETKLCNFCRSEIQRHETRWRCFHHCDFNVCEKCYREKAAQ